MAVCFEYPLYLAFWFCRIGHFLGKHIRYSVELSDAEMHLYSRQILLDGWDIEAQEKLKLANVLVVGCGGIGCLSAELLARAGVGKITLIDADVIETSNLQRQIAYTPADLGFYKAEILAKRLMQINPYIEIVCLTTLLDAQNAGTFSCPTRPSFRWL